jgi:hypothetical protein
MNYEVGSIVVDSQDVAQNTEDILIVDNRVGINAMAIGQNAVDIIRYRRRMGTCTTNCTVSGNIDQIQYNSFTGEEVPLLAAGLGGTSDMVASRYTTDVADFEFSLGSNGGPSMIIFHPRNTAPKQLSVDLDVQLVFSPFPIDYHVKVFLRCIFYNNGAWIGSRDYLEGVIQTISTGANTTRVSIRDYIVELASTDLLGSTPSISSPIYPVATYCSE